MDHGCPAVKVSEPYATARNDAIAVRDKLIAVDIWTCMTRILYTSTVHNWVPLYMGAPVNVVGSRQLNFHVIHTPGVMSSLHHSSASSKMRACHMIQTSVDLASASWEIVSFISADLERFRLRATAFPRRRI